MSKVNPFDEELIEHYFLQISKDFSETFKTFENKHKDFLIPSRSLLIGYISGLLKADTKSINFVFNYIKEKFLSSPERVV